MPGCQGVPEGWLWANSAMNWFRSLPMSVGSACLRSCRGTRSVGSWVLLVIVTSGLSYARSKAAPFAGV